PQLLEDYMSITTRLTGICPSAGTPDPSISPQDAPTAISALAPSLPCPSFGFKHDSRREGSMKKLVRLLGAAAALAAALPVQAQQVKQPSIRLTPYVGYMSFGSLVSGPLGSSLTNGGGPAYGAQVSVPLSPAIGVYGNVAYSRPG